MQDYPQFDFSTVIAARLVPVITEATDPDYIAAELGRARVANPAAQAKIEVKVEPTGAAIPPPRAATRRSPRGKGGEAPCKPPPPATHRRDRRGKATKSRCVP
jgi:hypothetical protein